MNSDEEIDMEQVPPDDLQDVQSPAFPYLGFKDVISRSVSLLLNRLDVYMTLSLVANLPIAVMKVFLFFLMQFELAAEENKTSNDHQEVGDIAIYTQNFTERHGPTVAALSMIYFSLEVVTMLLGEAGMIRATADTYLASQIQIGWFSCLKVGLQHFGSLLGSSVLFSGSLLLAFWVIYILVITILLIPLALVLLIVFIYGFILSTRFLLNAVVVENMGPIRAFKRSFELSRGKRCYIFLPLFLVWFVKVLLSLLLQALFSGEWNSLSIMELLGTSLGALILFVMELFFLPLITILKFVLYASVRGDKEGFNPSILQKELVQPMSLPSLPQYRHVPRADDGRADASLT